MPVTISGDGGIAGISSLGGGDFVAGSLTSSGDLIAGPQAPGRATLFVDDSDNSVSINTTVTPAAGVFLQVADATDPIVSLNNTGNGEVRLGCTAAAGYISTNSSHPLALQTNATNAIYIDTSQRVGISTTSPDSTFTTTINAQANPDALLLERTTGGAGAGVRLGFRNSDNENWTVFNNGNAELLFETDQGTFSANPKLLLRPDGRHVINRASSAQIYSALEIFQENTDLTNTFRAAFAVWDNTYNGENSGGGIDLGGRINTGSSYRTFGGIKGVKENATVNDTAGRLEIWTRAGSGTYDRKASFTSTGNLAFPNGQGIDFSATEGAGATSSLLDDYEEGTFTPSYGIGSAVATYNTQSGIYTKVGNKVTVKIILLTDGITGTLNSGEITIEGLPFQINGTCSITPWIAKWTAASFSGTVGYSIGLRGTNNTTSMRLYYQNASSGATIPRTELSTASNRNQVEFVFSYFTD